ncbi:MAG: RsmE family RNA methyltransferase [Treponema sp.]
MNIILLSINDQYSNNDFCFNSNDERYLHIKNILHLKENDIFKCGIINGKVGTGIIKKIDDKKLLFAFKEVCPPNNLYPINVIIGIPRPIQLKRLLKDITTMGVSSIHLVGTMLGEKSYMSSTLIENNNIEKYLIEGATQAGTTLLPTCKIHNSIYKFFENEVLQEVDEKIIFDINYKNIPNVSAKNIKKDRTIWLAFGSERGWSEQERNIFYKNNFKFITLGNRILRTETASIAGISYILTCMNEYI